MKRCRCIPTYIWCGYIADKKNGRHFICYAESITPDRRRARMHFCPRHAAHGRKVHGK